MKCLYYISRIVVHVHFQSYYIHVLWYYAFMKLHFLWIQILNQYILGNTACNDFSHQYTSSSLAKIFRPSTEIENFQTNIYDTCIVYVCCIFIYYMYACIHNLNIYKYSHTYTTHIP